MYLEDQFKNTQSILDAIRQIDNKLIEKDLFSSLLDTRSESEESHPSTIKDMALETVGFMDEEMSTA